MTSSVTALIADDEPLLARALQRALHAAWPELQVLATEHDGSAAIAQALALQPQLLFLDIQMPLASGLEVAAAVADDWPSEGPTPLLVFVTAFDQHAMAAFDLAAVDYVLKPINPERVAKTVARLQERLQTRTHTRPGMVASNGAMPGSAAQAVQLAQAMGGPLADPAAEKIRVLRVASGAGANSVRMVPLQEVVAIEATDKYATVVTESGDALVRISLRELMTRLDGVAFMQIHRGTLVATDRIQRAERDEDGHTWLHVRGSSRPFRVSRAFSHLFKPM